MSRTPNWLADVPRRRPRLWRSVALAVLLGGVGAAASGGAAWGKAQQEEATAQAQANVSAAAAALGASVQQDLAFQAVLKARIATTRHLTNRSLDAWGRALDLRRLYPDTAAFFFVERVPLAQLGSFVSQVKGDLPVGSPASAYSVEPPGRRQYYCLTRYVLENRPLQLPMGLDLCSPSFLPGSRSPLPGLLSEVAATGRSVAFGSNSLLPRLGPSDSPILRAFVGGFGDLFVVATPVYSGGSLPASRAAREAALRGWLLGSFDDNLLASPASAGRMAVTVSGMAPGAPVLRSGTPPKGPRVVASEQLATSPQLVVSVAGAALPGALAQGLFVGAAGSAISILVFAFLWRLTSTREAALGLVEQRGRELRHQALHDGLTGLPNRELLLDRAEQAMLRGEGDLVVTALVVDLDNFKNLNDSFGHEAGDELLRAVAARLAAAVRSTDTVGRLGGDEFLVLTEGASKEAAPELVAERLLSVLAEPFELATGAGQGGQAALRMGASIGVASGRRQSAYELLRDADVALYQAKTAGKNRFIVFHPEMQTAVQDRLSLEIDLRRALERGELHVQYQPIFDLKTLSAKGVEALVRWRHPERGLVPPAEFIPLAEETGLILEIGKVVLDRACAQAAGWRLEGRAVEVSVNVSVAQLEDSGFVGEVRAALERSRLPASALVLEVTESMLTRDVASSSRALKELKALGVRVAIDDFGTGYSSLSLLRQLPVDLLKIDRSFLARGEGDGTSEVLVRTLIGLGKALGIETLMEGIEEQRQLERLRAEECDSGQGFLLSRPLEPEAVVEYLAPAPQSLA